MATMTDVAKRAGVSLSTVSYAISGSRPISEATRERVFAAMRELDFSPNAVAQGLAGRRTRILGLLFPVDAGGILAPFTSEIIIGAAEAARESSHHLLLWTEPEAESTSIRLLLRQGLVDGVLVLAVRFEDERIEVLRAGEVPLAMIGRTGAPEGLPYADTDEAQTADLAIEHLAGLGHRRIAYVAPRDADPKRGYGFAVRVHDSLLAAAGRSAVSLRPHFVDIERDSVSESVVALLASAPDTTAIVALNDQVVAGVLAGAAAAGRVVPDDLSVVGMLVTGQVAPLMTPPVTTVGPDPYELGRRGAMLLVDHLTTPDQRVGQQLLPSVLVVRHTTAPVVASSH
jgi:DNA-binding LacI/PurR family transcriptional regulator